MMDPKRIIILIIVVLIILFPITAFTSTCDLAIFLQGAKTILEGGKIYVDFIDIKPIIAYYAMIPIYLISHFDNHSVRIIEFCVHALTTIWLGLYLYKKVNYRIALFSAIAYSLLVVTLNISESFQLELIFNFLIILLYIIHSKNYNKKLKKSILWIIFEGVIIGIYFSLKYTTGLILLGLLLFDLFYKKEDLLYFIKYYGTLSIGFLFAVILCFLPLINTEILNGYKEVMGYLNFYISVLRFDIPHTNIFLKSSSTYFVDKFSITFLIAVSITILMWFKKMNQSHSENSQRILAFSIFLVITLVLSVMIERKGFAYHYSRSYIPISVLVGFGLNELVNFFQKILKVKRLKIILPVSLIIITMIIFSPFSRFISVLRIPIIYYFDNEHYYNLFNEPENNPKLNYLDRKKACDFLNAHSNHNENLLTMNSGTYDIIQFQNLKVIDKFSHSAFYYGLYNNNKWRKEYLEQLTKADWIIIQKNDINYIANGHLRSTYESVQEDSVALNILHSRFNFAYENESFLLLHKKEIKQ